MTFFYMMILFYYTMVLTKESWENQNGRNAYV